MVMVSNIENNLIPGGIGGAVGVLAPVGSGGLDVVGGRVEKLAARKIN